MALVEPKITSLNPSETIVVVIPAGHTSGISNDYSLSVKILHDEEMPLDIHITLNALDSGLFRFENDHPYNEFLFEKKKKNDIVDLKFKIKNPVPLTGVPLRMRVIANDVNTPDTVMADSGTWEVSSH